MEKENKFDGGVDPDVAATICGAVSDADTWGLGRISEAKRRLNEKGLKWEEKYEYWIFKNFVE
jgi:hypothetical protein